MRWLSSYTRSLCGGWEQHRTEIPKKRFVATGSRRYGFPRADSDFDVICTAVDPCKLIERGFKYISGLEDDQEDLAQYPPSSDIVRFKRGRIDLLWCSREAFLERVEAMKQCAAIGPISRKKAVRIHKRVEKAFEDRRRKEAAEQARELELQLQRIKRASQFREKIAAVSLFDYVQSQS